MLYFILLDLYLEYVDALVVDSINKSGVGCFWARSLNICILGMIDKKTLKLSEILQLHLILPAWGLTYKLRSGSRGGKIIRPFKGRLYIDRDGHLQWERPESVIEI